ncbi:MAG: phage Gp37/Gp68 family protein [Muribaculaceae bacterium]|nr:phage Gp37/Gp68 family protein [Muribaculaceae bacterium]
MIIWNPWHGCHKISEGCDHCYMYFLDRKRGIDTSRIVRTSNFDLPLRRDRHGNYKLKPGMQLYVGLSTDFFVDEADEWRADVWRMIRHRTNIAFRILTKRADRIARCLPHDSGDGYPKVMLSVTCENQQRADERLPLLLEIPAAHKGFMAAPFIGPIEAADYLATGQIEEVLCGGENYDGARPCHYEWVKSVSEQCAAHGVTCNFIETVTIFYRNGKRYHIPSKRIQSQQAFRSELSHYHGKPIFSLEPTDTVLFDREKYRPHFRTHCSTCGSRLTCNGCSDCSNCDYR